MEFQLRGENGTFKIIVGWIDHDSLRATLYREYPGPASAPGWERAGECILSGDDLTGLLDLIVARPS